MLVQKAFVLPHPHVAQNGNILTLLILTWRVEGTTGPHETCESTEYVFTENGSNYNNDLCATLRWSSVLHATPSPVGANSLARR